MTVPSGVYVGQSTCDLYSSALGAGQKVLSYTYYTPWRTVIKQYMDNGKPTDTVERFLELLKPLAESAKLLYPDWRMRIYHNVTENDTEVEMDTSINMSILSFCRLSTCSVISTVTTPSLTSVTPETSPALEISTQTSRSGGSGGSKCWRTRQSLPSAAETWTAS